MISKDQAIKALIEAAEVLSIKKNSLVYKSAMEAVENPGTSVVCGHNSGSGRYSSSVSWLLKTKALLTSAGIDWIEENVSPKGGRAGDRIIVQPYHDNTNIVEF
jgi:hydrogenase maturation factor